MAFTEEQEEILKRIIEAFQNGKTINDLPRFVTNGQNAYDLPIETIMPASGRSGYIKAGVLHNALNDKAQINANIESLMQKTAFADAPMISLDTQCLAGWNGRVRQPDHFSQIELSSIRIKNASYYIDKGCKIAFFRKIKQINNINEYDPDIDIEEDAHYFNYKKKKHKGWRLWDLASEYDGWSLEGFRLDQTGKVLWNGNPITADFLILYKTVEKITPTMEKYEVMRVLWGAKSKEFPLDTNAKHSPYKFPLALAFCDDEWNIISNIVPFHVLVYYGYPINQDEYKATTDKWNFCFTY